jgi:IPT/TIG domain
MADFSKLPQQALDEAQARGYVGVYFEQGVPVLDRDLNLLQDLVAATVRTIVARYLGDGTAAGSDAFAIRAASPPANDFMISGGGHCLVGGIEVAIGTPVAYGAQVPAPARLSMPAAAREDVVFLDVSLTTVAGDGPGGDPDLLNAADVGMQTSLRVKPAWTVRVAEGARRVPDAAAGHVHYELARLRRTAGRPIEDGMIDDRRQTRLNLAGLEQRMRIAEDTRVLPKLTGEPPFQPPIQPPGGTIRITGDNFDLDGLDVLFGTDRADLVTFVDRRHIEATVPNKSGSVAITVTTAGGSVTSTGRPFTYRVPAPGPVLKPPPDEFSPRSGQPGRTTVTLAGKDLDDPPVSVMFGAVAAQLGARVADDAVEALVPDGVLGPVRLVIRTGLGRAETHDGFIAGTPPTFDARRPFSAGSSGPGATLTLTGTGFDQGAVTVSFGDVARDVLPSRVSANTLDVIVPNVASAVVAIIVRTAVGSVSSAPTTFTIRNG